MHSIDIVSYKSARSVQAKQVLIVALDQNTLIELGLSGRYASPEFLLPVIQLAWKEIGRRVKTIILCDNKYYIRKFANTKHGSAPYITLCSELTQLVCEELFFVSPFLDFQLCEIISKNKDRKTTQVTGFSYLHTSRLNKIINIPLYLEKFVTSSSFPETIRALHSTGLGTKFDTAVFLRNFLDTTKIAYQSGILIQGGSADALFNLFAAARLPNTLTIKLLKLDQVSEYPLNPDITNVILYYTNTDNNRVGLSSTIHSTRAVYKNAYITIFTNYDTHPQEELLDIRTTDFDRLISELHLSTGFFLSYVYLFSDYSRPIQYSYDMDKYLKRLIGSVDMLAMQEFYRHIRPYQYSNAVLYPDLWYDIYSKLSEINTSLPAHTLQSDGDESDVFEAPIVKLKKETRKRLIQMILHKTYTQEMFLKLVKKFIISHYRSFMGVNKVEKLRKALILFEFPFELIDDLDPDPRGSKWKKKNLEGRWRQGDVKITVDDLTLSKDIETSAIGALQWLIDNMKDHRSTNPG